MAVLYIVGKHIPLMQRCFSFLSFRLFRFSPLSLVCYFTLLHNIADKKKCWKRAWYMCISAPFTSLYLSLHFFYPPPPTPPSPHQPPTPSTPGKNKQTLTTRDQLVLLCVKNAHNKPPTSSTHPKKRHTHSSVPFPNLSWFPALSFKSRRLQLTSKLSFA